MRQGRTTQSWCNQSLPCTRPQKQSQRSPPHGPCDFAGSPARLMPPWDSTLAIALLAILPSQPPGHPDRRSGIDSGPPGPSFAALGRVGDRLRLVFHRNWEVTSMGLPVRSDRANTASSDPKHRGSAECLDRLRDLGARGSPHKVLRDSPHPLQAPDHRARLPSSASTSQGCHIVRCTSKSQQAERKPLEAVPRLSRPDTTGAFLGGGTQTAKLVLTTSRKTCLLPKMTSPPVMQRRPHD